MNSDSFILVWNICSKCNGTGGRLYAVYMDGSSTNIDCSMCTIKMITDPIMFKKGLIGEYISLLDLKHRMEKIV